MTWMIQAITDELTGQEILIERDMLVGRHQTADLILQSAEISRKHAAFLVKEDALWLQDLGSSNGTFVNDVRIQQETLLKNGDIIQFASLKFSVLTTSAKEQLTAVVEEITISDAKVDEPSVTTNVTQEKEHVEAVEKTAAEQMNDQGMPELKERDTSVKLARDGMPQGVAVPKPAPIPEDVDVTAVKQEPKPTSVEQPITRVEQEKEVQKNASVGLITVIVLIIVAIIAWILFGK